LFITAEDCFCFAWASTDLWLTQKFEFWTEQLVCVKDLLKYNTFVESLISQNFEHQIFWFWFVHFVSL
jgi:hypothetical protein